MTRPVFIEGKRVSLVLLSADDASVCCTWQNDLRTIIDLGSEPLPTGAGRVEEQLAKAHDSHDKLMLGIQVKSDGRLVGMGGLPRIEWINQRGELTLLIGSPDDRSKGYGSEATGLILDHAFTKLNLHSVMLRVIAYNEAGIRCYEKCGFKLIGRRREAKAIDGQYFDVLYMDILAAEHPTSKADSPTRR